MSSRLRIAGSDILVVFLTLGFAWACAAFVRQPTLAGFADDSVSYLVMAQVFSPYREASQAVLAAFAREAFYPPLFPAVLALAGAAHDIAWAHVLTALLVAASIPGAYALGVHWLEDRRAAALAVFCLALLPAMWVNAKGILSEPLFGLLLLGAFCVLASGRESDRGLSGARLGMLAALMAAMLLTRTAALVMIFAYALWALTRRAQPFAARARAALPAAAAIAAYLAWVALRPAATADNYARIVLDHGGVFLAADNPLAAIGASLLRQANAVGEAWVGSLLLFWVEGRPIRPLIAGIFGGFALGGIALRLGAGKADAWMTAGYLATFLLWPFYDQMGRFLFPVLPVLVLYAFWAAARALQFFGRPPVFGQGLLAVLVLSLAAPALAFMHQRAQVPGRYAEIVDWYRTPDLAQARARAELHLDLFADMDEIARRTRPDDRIAWVAPSYLALLADRHGVVAPDLALPADAYREAVRTSGADYVFLSRYHPRDTLRTLAWQSGTRALTGHVKPVHVRTQGGGSVVTSMLLKVDK